MQRREVPGAGRALQAVPTAKPVFTGPAGQVTITKDYIEKKGAPVIEMRGSGEAKLLMQRDALPETDRKQKGL